MRLLTRGTRSGVVLLITLLALWIALPALAQTNDDVSTARDSASLPDEVMLEGFSWIHQGTNRCSAAALTIHLSYYQPVSVDTYREMANRVLNTFGADASVRIEEMADAAEARGLNAVVRRGGTIGLMRELLAAGFPVLVENSYYEGSNFYTDWLSHNRVLIGYNDSLQTFYFQDPLLGFPDGQLIEFTYEDFDTRWKPFNRDYMVFYTDDEADTLQAVLGQQWDDTSNAGWTLQQAQAEIDSGERDGLRYSYYNRGWAQVQLGEYEAAAASFDVALADDNLADIGTRLPQRFLWYDFSVFEAYMQVERYDDVLALARQQIGVAGDSISVEEWYYYAARAYEAQGNLERARLNYEVALFRNRNFTAAQQRLQALGADSG